MPDASPSNLLLFFGHFHPLLVHLPIGFLTLLAVLELANRIHHFKHAAQARGVVLLFTVIASILTVVCGLMLATEGGYDAHLLAWHKWMGIALAASCIVTAVAYWTKLRRAYAGLLMVTLLLLGPASHFGGSITHGEGYLTEYAPQWVRSIFQSAPPPTTTAEKETPTTEKSPPDPEHAIAFADIIQPILTQNCISCHSAEKLKGDLRLDSFEAIAHGGKSGPAAIAHNVSDSPLIKRLDLPLSDPKHMPPPGKSPLSDDDIALLKWWIDSGASSDKAAADLDPPVHVADVIAAKLGAPPPPSTDPVALAEIQPQIEELSTKLGIIIQTNAVDQPWVSVNASMNRTFADSDIAALAPLARNITSLNLAGTRITDAALSVVAKMPSLEHLRLERTDITDAGLKTLSKLRRLDYLNLYGTAITPTGLQTLRGLPSLHHLYLWRTSITTQAATQFADSLVDHAKIARLQEQIVSLQNQISSQSVEVVAGTPAPTTAPATKPATAPATKPASAPAAKGV